MAAGAALEELRKARMKRRKSTHLVVVQKLFTPLWLKQLYKVCDIVIFLPAKYHFWTKEIDFKDNHDQAVDGEINNLLELAIKERENDLLFNLNVLNKIKVFTIAYFYCAGLQDQLPGTSIALSSKPPNPCGS